jgi:hypothetical protein
MVVESGFDEWTVTDLPSKALHLPHSQVALAVGQVQAISSLLMHDIRKDPKKKSLGFPT